MKIKVDSNNYVTDYCTIGDISDSIEVETPAEFDEETFLRNHSAYKLVDNALVLDEDKLATINQEYEYIELNKQYIPSQIKTLMEIGKLMTKLLILTDEDKIKISGIYDKWKPGSYEVGDIYNAAGQTWECFQAYDNAIYPDINPHNSAWYTFNKPLHGKSKETARLFTPVQGAHDMYKTGEYCIYNNLIYKCIQDTNFSPDEYAPAWKREGTA